MSYRKKYEEAHGKIPKGFHVHHIVPKCYGGTNDLSNLIALSPEDHFAAHYALWERYGRIGDLRACQFIKGCHLDLTVEERKLIASKGGKASQKTLKEKKLSSFYNPEQHAAACSAGGKVGRFSDEYYRKRGVPEEKIAEEKSKEQASRGRRGGIKNKGVIILNNGKKLMHYTAAQQEKMSVEEFIKKNPEWIIGKSEYVAAKFPDVTCPHCGKTGKEHFIKPWHFDNCSVVTGKKRNLPQNINVTCPHCGKTGNKPIMKRYHFDRCKYRRINESK